MDTEVRRINVRVALANGFIPKRVVYNKKESGVEVQVCDTTPRAHAQVAIKFTHFARDDHGFEKFTKECGILWRLNHENVIGWIRMLCTCRVGALVMECVSCTVAQLMRAPCGVTRNFALNTTYQTLNGLAYLHSSGVTHHDISDRNIGITDVGTVKIIDFDLASTCQAETRACRYIRGTPYYMAPEVMEKRHHDERIDVWGCGVLFHVMLTGVLPFEADDFGNLVRIVTDYDYTGVALDTEADNGMFEAFAMMCAPQKIRFSAATMMAHPVFECIRRAESFTPPSHFAFL